jgi:hypothetical protein
VHGNAKKYLINPDWQRLPFQMQPEGFPTPVLLRRENYVNILEGVGADHTFGDIFSLDLSAPNQLGIFTVLLSSPQTPDYELQYYQNNENGFSAASFEDVLANLPKR